MKFCRPKRLMVPQLFGRTRSSNATKQTAQKLRPSFNMSGAFYSRYVPPGKPSARQGEAGSVNGQKRKHEEPTNGDGSRPKKHKKDQTTSASLQAPGESKHAAGESSRSFVSPGEQTMNAPSNEDVLAKYSVTKHAQAKGTNQNDITRRKGGNGMTLKSLEVTSKGEKYEKSYMNGSRTQNTVVEDHKTDEIEDEDLDDEDHITHTKHPSVMSKFKR